MSRLQFVPHVLATCPGDALVDRLVVGVPLIPPPLQVLHQLVAVVLSRLLRVIRRVLQVSVLGRHVCAACEAAGASFPDIGREETQGTLVSFTGLGGQIIEAETCTTQHTTYRSSSWLANEPLDRARSVTSRGRYDASSEQLQGGGKKRYSGYH